MISFPKVSNEKFNKTRDSDSERKNSLTSTIAWVKFPVNSVTITIRRGSGQRESSEMD